jgi:hypothetical protein
MHFCQNCDYGNLQELTNAANLRFPKHDVEHGHYVRVKGIPEDLKACNTTGSGTE